MIDPHSALIYTMVLVSAADRDMTDSELQTIGETVKHLPIFRDYDADKLTETARHCAELLSDADGLNQTLDMIVSGLPERLRETAYALACEVAVADGRPSREELRLLEILRERLDVDQLAAAAIERAVRARHAEL